jgi:hypothetical protein
MLTSLPRRWARDERGAIAVVTALVTAMVLMVVGALTVDLGSTWSRRGDLQSQADHAAMFAANYLPASTQAEKLVAAKAAVQYIACNPVVGQEASVNAAYPVPRGSDGSFSCPNRSFDARQTTYDAAASALMTSGAITFPNRFEIVLSTPRSKVEFGFAKVVGADDSVQQMTAAAHVYSPGSVLPMGGSIGCLAAAANNTGLLGLGDTLSKLIPINYWSAGGGANSYTRSDGSSAVDGTVSWPAITAPQPVLPQNLTTDSATFNAALKSLTVTYSINTGLTGLAPALVNGLLNNLLGSNVTVWFGRGTTNIPVNVPLTVLGSATVAVPSQVLTNPGNWWVKVVAPMPTYGMVLGLPVYKGSAVKSATTQRQVNIAAESLDVTNLDNFMSCARPMVSPRATTHGTSRDMIDNLRKGIDHPLSQHPSLITAAGGLTNPATTSLSTLVTGLLQNPTGFAFKCGSDAVSIPDTAANITRSPNCVNVDTTTTFDYEFTQGFLTDQGRLSCSVSPCEHGTFNGSDLGLSGTYNNDQVSDFISGANQQGILNDLLLTTLDTYLLPSIPVLTPANQISSDIYRSPRFFWAPVLTTVYLPGQGAAAYPVLTFRPAFMTQESPTPGALQQLLSSLAIELRLDLSAVIAAGITGLLNGTLISSLLNAISLNVGGTQLLGNLGDPTKKEKYGMVVDTSSDAAHRLKALRIMTINPGAMPAVDPDYAGPVTDYLGSGPKVIRLVK